jgi:DNA-binding NtrC family response regulator
MNQLLLIEDDLIMGESLAQRLEIEGYIVFWCKSLKEAKATDLLNFSAVISDVRLPDGVTTKWFAELPVLARSIPWFFLTAHSSIEDAITATKHGAREYLTKPFDIERLIDLIKKSIPLTFVRFEDAPLGVSPVMRSVEKLVKKIAQQRVALLISGETGVGKEVVAQYLHSQDARSQAGKFIAVNCAAIPENLMESEFFGYEKGAFSGAHKVHHGYLERANNGTLFLDEVGELPLAMQAKLLRALQEKTFSRLGSEAITSSEFRLISATNRNLVAEMQAGRFREDFFYRLAVIRIDLPPLRERPEDILWLTEKILGKIRLEQSRALAVSENFLRDLLKRPWRGNVRELQSYLEQATIMSDTGVLDMTIAESLSISHDAENPVLATLEIVVQAAEKTHIARVLDHCDGSINQTAARLGISRKTLWEKMKRLGISAE